MYQVAMNPLASRIALGTVQFGLDYGISNDTGIVSSNTAADLLARAHALGIDTLDTARVYGISETVLGRIGTRNWKVVSKFMPSAGQSVQNALENSLEALQCESLYGYLSHSGEHLISHPGVWEEMQKLKTKGRINKTGYSLYLTEHLDQLLELGMIPDIIQVQYNLFDRRFEPYFAKLKSAGTEIHTRSCFLQGLFFLTTYNPYFEPLKTPLEQLKQLFPEPGRRAAALIRFCLDREEIDKIVIGIRNPEELTANLHELETMPAGSLAGIEPPNGCNDLLLPYNWPKKS